MIKNKQKPLIELRNFAQRVVHEGVVLIKNENNVLPIINKKVAVFGRIQTDYYKSGTGSGGLVNVTDVPSWLDAITENPRIDINNDLVKIYQDWISENPFNFGNGMWASEPWAQEEMLIRKDQIDLIKRENEIAMMIIGRTAGEDRDNFLGEGSYELSQNEKKVLKLLKEEYEQVVVLLNVGNIIDINYFDEIGVDSILYAWHGGQDGARGTMDVVTGYISPSGKLPDTIFKDLEKYPANEMFGQRGRVYYNEDIYVGYRYSETFAPEIVKYPFGFGLSYTTFNIELKEVVKENEKIIVDFNVANTGKVSGKETAQIYFSAPQGLLGKPKYQLIGFAKTKELKPNENTNVNIKFDINKMASYDDEGLIEKSAYVLEKGNYKIYLGTSVKNLNLVYEHIIEEDVVVEKLTEIAAPIKKFERIKAFEKNGKIFKKYVPVTTKSTDTEKTILNSLPTLIEQNKENINLLEVYKGNKTIDQFVGSLTVEEMSYLVLGEGMSSPKVTSGTAGAIGGVTTELENKGLSLACCADGPSGIRMDSGNLATSLPNGTLLASTMNNDLIEHLYYLEGLELKGYDIDILLGPGMNIHRHPLNGRNFEYFSEDPLLTGMMASAVVRGLNKAGVYGAMKHLACNNQETDRFFVDAILSERALREIYLKGFEIAVKESEAEVIMTAYNPVNGIWTASNYDINTTVLRGEWGFKGFLMTDWWAQMNDEKVGPSKSNISQMVRSQNDVYMVVQNSKEYESNLIESYDQGEITLEEIQRSAKNLVKFVMKTHSFSRKHNLEHKYIQKEINPWFNVEKEVSKLNYIQKDRFNNYITFYENEIYENEKSEFNYIESNNDVQYAVLNGGETLLYKFGIKPNIIKDTFFDEIMKIENETYFEISNINWKEVILPLEEYIYVNEIGQNSRDWKNIEKGSIFSFPIEITEYGRYTINMTISSKESEISQMPFSVYVDNINQQTLTSNGTKGSMKKLDVNIILKPGKKILSYKFHKTGLSVHEIKIIKHG